MQFLIYLHQEDLKFIADYTKQFFTIPLLKEINFAKTCSLSVLASATGQCILSLSKKRDQGEIKLFPSDINKIIENLEREITIKDYIELSYSEVIDNKLNSLFEKKKKTPSTEIALKLPVLNELLFDNGESFIDIFSLHIVEFSDVNNKGFKGIYKPDKERLIKCILDNTPMKDLV